MENFFAKLFPFTISPKQRGSAIQNPFTAIFQQSMGQSFGVTAQQQFLKAYRGWVFASVQAIAQEVSNMQLRLMKQDANGEEEEIFEHEILEVINRVNPRMTRHELLEITQSHLELEGNAFWFLARDKLKNIRELWPLRPDRVTFAQDKENPLLIKEFIYRQKDGRKTTFDENDIIHFANFNSEADYPFPARGLGTVQAAALAIDTNFYTREWNKNFFLNSARPDVILKTDANLSPDDYEQLKRKFESGHQGLEKSHKMLLLQGGLEMDRLNFTQKEMDFVKQLIASRDEILAIFRVPKTVLGITDDVNRANAEATNFVFALRTIKPKMQKIVDTFNEFLLPKFGAEEGLFFTFDSPVPEDRVQVINEFTKGIDKWLTRNEIRAKEGLSPTVDGDRIFAPLNIAPIDTLKEEKKVKPPKSKKPKKKEKNLSAEKKIQQSTKEHIHDLFEKKAKKAKKQKKAKKNPRNLTHNQIMALKEVWVKSIEDNEKELKRVVQDYFDAQEKRVIENLKEELKGLTEKEYSLKQQVDLLPDKDSELEGVIDLLTPLYRDFVREGGIFTFQTFDLDFEFDLESPEVQEFIEQRAEFFGSKINDTTFEELLPAIEEGIREGEALPEISERVAMVYEKTRDFRTDRIARTEVAAAENFGNEEALRQAGIALKEWVNFDPPDATSDACSPIPAVAEVGEIFSNGLERPPVHPNCVCTIIGRFT